MKKIIGFTLLFFAFAACTKESVNNNNTTTVIRYQFTATLAGNYSFEGDADTVHFSETVNTASWSKTVTVQNNSAVQNATVTVFPPVDWLGTTNETDVTLKIFIDDVEKASGSAHFIAIDRPAGLTVSTTY